MVQGCPCNLILETWNLNHETKTNPGKSYDSPGTKVVKKQSSDKKVRRLRNIFRTFRTIFRTFRTPFRPSSALMGKFCTFTRNPSFKDENDLTRAQNPE